MFQFFVSLVLMLSSLGQSAPAIQVVATPVSLGSDDSLRFEKPKTEVKYTPTGFSVTAEAEQYPEAIKQLIKEGKDTIPVQTEVVKSNMVGFWTWRQTEAAARLLVKEGKLVVVRAPLSEREKQVTTKEFNNPFGLLVAVFLGLLLLSNWLMGRGSDVAAAVFVVAAVFAVAAFVAAATFAVAIFATVFAAAAGVVAVAVFEDIRAYRWRSAISGALMLTAVGLAIWG